MKVYLLDIDYKDSYIIKSYLWYIKVINLYQVIIFIVY